MRVTNKDTFQIKPLPGVDNHDYRLESRRGRDEESEEDPQIVPEELLDVRNFEGILMRLVVAFFLRHFFATQMEGNKKNGLPFIRSLVRT